MSKSENRYQGSKSLENPTAMSSSSLENDPSESEDRSFRVIVKGNEDLSTLISDVVRQRLAKCCEEVVAGASNDQVLVNNRIESTPTEELTVCPEGSIANITSNLSSFKLSDVETSTLSDVKGNGSLKPYEGSTIDEDSVTSDSSCVSSWLTVESDEDSKYPSTLEEESSGSIDSFKFRLYPAGRKRSVASWESSDSESKESPRRIASNDDTSSEDSSESDCSSSDASSSECESEENVADGERIVYDVEDSEASSESTDLSYHLDSESASDSEIDYPNRDGSRFSTSDTPDGSNSPEYYRCHPKSREFVSDSESSSGTDSADEFVSDSESSSATDSADEMWREDEDTSQIYSDIGTPLCMKTGKDKIIIFERNKSDRNLLAGLDLVKSPCSKTESREALTSVDDSEPSLKPYDKQMFRHYNSEDEVSSSCDFSLTIQIALNHPSRSDLHSTSTSNDESGSGNSPSYKKYPSVSEEHSPINNLPSVKLECHNSNSYHKF